MASRAMAAELSLKRGYSLLAETDAEGDTVNTLGAAFCLERDRHGGTHCRCLNDQVLRCALSSLHRRFVAIIALLLMFIAPYDTMRAVTGACRHV